MENVSLSLKDMKIITAQMEKSVCKIILENKSGTGFFCSIPLGGSQKVLALITASHVFDGKSNQLRFSINNDQGLYCLSMDGRKFYVDKSLDVTIIEIKPNDGLKEDSFLVFDFNMNLEQGNPIYLLSYEQASEVKSSAGRILKIMNSESEIMYDCHSSNGSAGGPLINLSNHFVIGLHKQRDPKRNVKFGSLLKEPFEKFKQIYNS